MNDIQIYKGQPVIDSREVAKMTGKKHKNLMRDIQKYSGDIKSSEYSSNLSSTNFFIPSTYKAGNGKINPCYLLTKQGCEFVANKMTGKKGNLFTAKYVSMFNQMQVQVQSQFQIPQTYGEALRLAADQQEELEKARPKVEYFDNQMRNPGLMTTTEIAKDYGWSAKKLNSKLHELGVQYRQGKHWVLYQKYADKGYTQYEPFPYDDNKGVHNNLKWTQKGKKFIYDLLANEKLYPVLEQMALIEN